MTVDVLSVDRVSFSRKEYSNSTSETTKFVAKARIQKVLTNEHDLSPGSVIEIRYDVTVRKPPLRGGRSATLKAGETVTLSIFGSASTFTWNNILP